MQYDTEPRYDVDPQYDHLYGRNDLKAVAAKYISHNFLQVNTAGPSPQYITPIPFFPNDAPFYITYNAQIEHRLMDGDIVSQYLVNNPGATKRQAYEYMLAEAARKLSVYERYPKEDPLEDGDVIKFFKVFPNDPTYWQYAAVRTNGKYYVTGGKTNPQGYSWDELVDWMSDHVQEVFVVTPNGWERIVPVEVVKGIEEPRERNLSTEPLSNDRNYTYRDR